MIALSDTTAVIGANLRTFVDAAPCTSIQHARVGLTVTLARVGERFALTLLSDFGPIQQTTADLWAAAVGAPSVEWERTMRGRCVRCEWTEAGR